SRVYMHSLFNHMSPTASYPLSLHDALPICLPVVKQDRARPVSSVASCKSLLIQSMIRLAKMVQSLIRIYHHRCRRLKFFGRLKFPVETMRMDPHHQSGRIIRIDFRLREKIAAVYQSESDRFSLKFIRSRTFQDNARVMVVGSISSYPAHGLDPCSSLRVFGYRSLDHAPENWIIS